MEKAVEQDNFNPQRSNPAICQVFHHCGGVCVLAFALLVFRGRKILWHIYRGQDNQAQCQLCLNLIKQLTLVLFFLAASLQHNTDSTPSRMKGTTSANTDLTDTLRNLKAVSYKTGTVIFEVSLLSPIKYAKNILLFSIFA